MATDLFPELDSLVTKHKMSLEFKNKVYDLLEEYYGNFSSGMIDNIITLLDTMERDEKIIDDDDFYIFIKQCFHGIEDISQAYQHVKAIVEGKIKPHENFVDRRKLLVDE